jgi:hypothetical protein
MLLSLLAAQITTASAAEPWRELRVYVDCERQIRVEACTRVSGFVVESAVLRPAPRSDADVVVHISATAVATYDEVLLRFTSDGDAAPSSLETVQRVDTTATADAQWIQLEPAFLRGVAPYVMAVAPSAITVALEAPASGPAQPESTSPWDFSVRVGGWGNWSGDFSHVQTDGSLAISRTTERSRLTVAPGVSRQAAHQPPLVVGDEVVSLDSEAWDARLHVLGVHNLDEHWSVGTLVRAGAEDEEAQFEATARAHAGVEYNWFPADDARGNSLALSYLVGWQGDRYNQMNVLGETEAAFASHMVLLGGDIRKDHYKLGIDVSARAQLLDPGRRYVLDAGTWGSVVLGPHVDLSFGVGVTRQVIPGPYLVDSRDFEAVTQADYAQPLSSWSRAQLTLHWDRTNAAQNNRFRIPGRLGALSNM